MSSELPIPPERILGAIAEVTPDFLYALDLSGRFLYANRRLLEVWGISAAQAAGRSLSELGYPQWHADMHMRELRQVIETKNPIRGVVPFTGGSGISGVYEYIFNPVLDADGRVEYIVGTTREVTQQAGAHEALQERERWLRGLLEATPECVKLVGPDGELLFMNQSGLRMIEASSEEAVRGASTYALIAPEHRSVWQEMHRRVCAGEKLSWEFDIIGLHGTRRAMETHAVPLALPDGRVAQLAVTRDVTRRRTDERMAAHLAAVVESSDDAIVSKNLDGIIQSWNAGAERVFGYTAAETVGRSILMLIPPERQDEENVILARLRAGERIDHFESVRVTKSGQRIDVSLTISPVKDAGGRIIAASKIARDISRQKHAERELQAAKDAAERANIQKDELLRSERAARGELEQANRIKDEFLATLSHELRTPLNAVLGWSQVLVRSPLPADALEGVQIIERNARAQAQIIEDLLDMNRIMSGKLRLDVQRIDLPVVISAAVETLSAAANAKSVRVSTVLDPLAGPIMGDSSRLQQVFWNLLSNAVKFTPKGGRIQVLLERVNSHVEVSVIDTGEGIDPSFLAHVFDRFRQAEGGSDRRHSGLGLGLAIVKQLVELHGGSVRVKSGGPGTGATFTVMLPVTPVAEPPPASDSERRHPAVGGMPVSAELCDRVAGVKVLIVDDEPDARALVKRLLEDCAAIVITAGSADEAIELLRRESPDVLVSDIGMPHQDGYALIRRVRALSPREGGDIPAIALTAYARAEDRMKAVVAGFQQHVVKPVEPAELITLVAVLAEGRSPRR